MKHRRAGFTLVELIVVIAILGILAGIAIPVYSRYVKKANEAADEQLLAAVNTAFASACLENGYDAKKIAASDVGAGSITLDGDGKIATVSPFPEEFNKYFTGNEDKAFKVYKSLRFKTDDGVFEGLKDGGQSTAGILVPGYTWTGDTAAAAAAYNNSNYSTMGVEGLTGTVDSLAGALSDYPQLFRVTQTEAFAETMEKLGIDLENADNATKANAAVFFVADQMSKMDTGAVLEALQNENLGTGSGLDDYLMSLDGLTQDDAIFLGTAIRYGIATSYVYSGYATPEEKAGFTSMTPTNRTQAAELIREATKGDGYLAYLYADANDPSGAGAVEDANAFFSIMNLVSQNTGGFNDISGSNLFSDPEVQDAINNILGITP